MASAKETTNHQEIKKWVESHGGRPTFVHGTGGMLRIDFGEKDDNLDEVSWDEFFEKFDESGVKFIYSPDAKSRFNKFVSQ